MNSDSHCIFCEMIKAKSYNIFYRDSLCAAVVEFCPKNVGHFLVIPLRHIETLAGLSDEEFLQLRKVALDILTNRWHEIDFVGRYEYFAASAEESDIRVIDRCNNAIDLLNREVKLTPSGFSCGFNEGLNSGKEHGHFHMHVVPAYHDRANEHGFRFMF